MEASRVGTVEAVRELMAAGADPNAQVVLGNALMKAAEEGHYEVVQILLAAGADPTVALPNEPSRLQEHAGKTAAEIAMMNGHRRVAELLSAGAKEYQLRRSGNLREAWRRLEAVLSKMNPPAFAALRSGATLEDLSLLASERGEPLPAAAQEFFEIHDGQRAVQSAAFITAGPESDKPFRLLALTEVAREWHVWNRLRLGGEFRDQRSQPDSGVRNDWFHAGWIPLTSNAEGDNHCLDLAPAPGGTSGQVILLRHDNPSRPLLAPSLAEWVDELAANLEKKK
jgi:cell wall assembly regulator SMI1